MKDWSAWHGDYEDPATPLARRLAIVQRQITRTLDDSPLDTVRIVSLCAGDGRDVIGAIGGHPRAASVRGRLVELDPGLAARARSAVAAAGLALDVVEGDAGRTDTFAGAVPADLLLACGVFGNISDRDVEGTIQAMPRLIAAGATVIWTRHRRPPDLTPAVRQWFAAAGFEEIAFEPVPDSAASVGVARFAGRPRPFRPGVRLFEFVSEADRSSRPVMGGGPG